MNDRYTIAQFGNPVLRTKATKIDESEIVSAKIQSLITALRGILIQKELGVGLAAPQIGEGVALAVIAIRPLPHRPKVETFDAVLINPEIIAVKGRKTQMWEGCISSGKGTAGLFAKVPRYKEVQVRYCDENGTKLTRTFKGLPAHVVQHEVDHLNGVLFVDKVKDTSTFMTYGEYKKMKQREQAVRG